MDRPKSQKMPLAQAAGLDSGYILQNPPFRKNKYVVGLEQRIAELEEEIASALWEVQEAVGWAERADAACIAMKAERDAVGRVR